MKIFSLPLIPYISLSVEVRHHPWQVVFGLQPFIWAFYFMSNRTHTEIAFGPVVLSCYWNDMELADLDHEDVMRALAKRDNPQPREDGDA